MRERASQTDRDNFPEHRGWFQSKKGNWTLKYDGRVFVLKQSQYGDWACSWVAEKKNDWTQIPGWHKTMLAAKPGAFDALYYVVQPRKPAVSVPVSPHQLAYTILGIHPNATSAEVHAAYRRMAMSTHPDRGGNAAAFRQVQLAFEVLSQVEAHDVA